MHRTFVAMNPTVGLEFMYHRSDGLWLFKIDKVRDGKVYYRYVYYKGRENRRHVSLHDLVDYADGRDWKGGTWNAVTKWRRFMLDPESATVQRIEVYNGTFEPDWEV
jgi:hypothetical protein